mmetsp:Transcript_15090/g.57319  ORF Transcript_15090/g.57319 Transcript_15090/m.57319 type:complete len:103 (+) Transcript_15090:305-613(+)
MHPSTEYVTQSAMQSMMYARLRNSSQKMARIQQTHDSSWRQLLQRIKRRSQGSEERLRASWTYILDEEMLSDGQQMDSQHRQSVGQVFSPHLPGQKQQHAGM